MLTNRFAKLRKGIYNKLDIVAPLVKQLGFGVEVLFENLKKNVNMGITS